MKTETLAIRGMICRPCEDAVARGLLSLPGVATAEPDYLKARVRIRFDESLTSTEALCAKLESLGYPEGKGISGAFVDIVSLVFVLGLFLFIQLLPASPKAQQGMSLGVLFLIGVLSSIHCVGMCGGIMLTQVSIALPAKVSSGFHSWDSFRGALLYNGGRFISCCILGAFFGAVGGVFSYTTLAKAILFAFAGLAVILFGLRLSGFIVLSLPTTNVSRRMIDQMKRLKRTRLVAFGMLNAFMPCGALATLWMVAMSAGSAFGGVLVMGSFALGTLPLMIALGSLCSFFPSRKMQYIVHAGSIMMIAFGLSLAVMGLRLL